MKKYFVFIFIFMMSIQFCYAKDYSLNFNGTKYHLLYSVKNKDFGGYLNEYYRQGETYNIWTDMVAVHHFPNAYSPIDRIKDFKDYLSSMNVPSSLTFDDKKNAAMIDFIIIKSDKIPVILEFNIFKYEKSKKCGSIAVQYVKRYAATTTMQVEQIKNDFENNRKKLIKKVKEFSIPQVVTEDIDKCISGLEVNKQDTITENNPAEVVNVNNVKEEEKQEERTENETEMTLEEAVPQENATENDVSTDTEISECKTEEITDEKEVETSINNNIIKEETNECEETNTEESPLNKEEIKETETESTEEFAEEEKEEEKAITKDETEDIKEKDNEDAPTTTEAPVPQLADEKNEIKRTPENDNNSNENIKNLNYQIINDKESFYAKPRTKRELKEEQKQCKKNTKLKNTSYLVTNNKNDYIAEPRTKKEMQEYKKALKNELRQKRKKKSSQ